MTNINETENFVNISQGLNDFDSGNEAVNTVGSQVLSLVAGGSSCLRSKGVVQAARE
ncbi:hypothetical protein [Ponticoccus litoralis]|uniref:Uncharacterized protein n=1 Tax=Ponticoccus litoralis TaxID=422297 RepID=A0AAW9SMY6_9RHOB